MSIWVLFLRSLIRLSVVGMLASVNHAQAKSDDWYLATMNRFGGMTWLDTGAHQPMTKAPLGSAWKLFVYAYITGNNLPENPYTCHIGQAAQADDEYCCMVTERIERDVALARSCGPYFEPSRLGITSSDWQNYWKKHAPQVTWLHQLRNLSPQTELPVEQILTAMNQIPQQSMIRSREALMQRLLQPTWGDVLSNLGTGYRFKTFTWHHPNILGAYFGGAVGWLADGSSFWVGGMGGSHTVLEQHAMQITRLLSPATQNVDEGCVMVDYFTRYPISQVLVSGTGQVAQAGVLRGQFVVKFVNGQQLSVRSAGELHLLRSGLIWRIVGQLGTEEYVARVVDREGDATQTQAARALAIAARSYLKNNGHYHQMCWHIDDDSRFQRVSPNPASKAAREVAAYTEGLTLTGSPIFYHQNQSADNTLNWQLAVQNSVRGINFITQLREAYPKASWEISPLQQQCAELESAQNYLNQTLPQVRRILAGTKGLEHVDNLQICRLDYGNPYADATSHRIYLRDWRGVQDKTTLWHEYLHLALRYHPSGQDENTVEQMATDLMKKLSIASYINQSHNQKKIVRRAQ
ncbi:DUF2300 domain-containing protein [Hydromonas duriensis]|uniref:Uncharacterized protein YfaQ (DUF2300 family) n=1 Tax=Hydromonas duriensis TaxID=1527608 RepID=A0A4R6Y8R5_9BURK|nr:DUF2300 domain-containing protein [Hydromonas duriensis]TDR31815.1 uncharacterized protein YfaQ (DUF2300 family) [Hydromonas duriensis]